LVPDFPIPGKKETPLKIKSGVSFLQRVGMAYPAEMAFTGHTDSQAAQSMQLSASMTYCPSPALMASTGHSLSQEAQFVQLSEIT
jgi:hypothetical protein